MANKSSSSWFTSFTISSQCCISPLHVFRQATYFEMIWVYACSILALMIKNFILWNWSYKPLIKSGVNEWPITGIAFIHMVDMPVPGLKTSLPYPAGTSVASIFDLESNWGFPNFVPGKVLKSLWSFKGIAAAALAKHTDSITRGKC